MEKQNPKQRRPDQGQQPKKRPDQQGGNRPEDRQKERDDGTE